ncbi:importin beta-3 subunit [Xylona heveae TC161]|uniref:Importin beta-3 subunit n=1 Tax=Xylona heveae (strain CBS 132557 / TC161) TaxID=1328760 RepID=A0A165I956_XYLHT|nr:importin beta-3 subunit [Xylona heveae TC161]KZF24570.1 importin beta-3 subunit [Xylona heveae TC161]
MAVLPAEVHNALSQLLQGLSSADNAVRSQAEEQLNNEWVIARPDVLLVGLVEQIQGAAEPSTRSFAAVLFRRISTKTRKDPKSDTTKELFLTLDQPQKTVIRTKLLECLANESLPHVRNKVGDAIAEIARQYVDDGESWPELLGALFQASQSTDAGQREGSFRIFATTPDIIEKQHEEMVLGAFSKGFKDDDISVRLAAVEAIASFFRAIDSKSRRKYYSLIPDILNILPPLKDAQDSDELSRALMALIDLAESAPRMFKHLFHNLVTFSITVIQDKELEDQTRQNALELMATFADYDRDMCRKDPSYTNEMVTQCLSLMTDIGMDDDDAAEWNASEDLDIEDSDLNHVAGEQTMDRLANKLGGQTILPPTFNWLPRMMTSSAWRDRHAALMAISAISEGCQELMVGELDKVLDLVVPALRDPHSRVRWAGCNAIGQMSTDFAGTMQEKYHQIVMANIIPVLESTEPRVQAHAAAALVNFCEEAEKSILEPYLDDLLSHLLQLLQSPKRFVQEQALSTIATVADSAETAFSKYYDTLMPLLFNVLREEQSKEYRLLRAKAMECATLIALAVGEQKMGQDAIALLQVLAAIQQTVIDADDPQATYLPHCWGRMCRVLRQGFLPYLSFVMPPLMELASAKADIQLLDDEEQVAQMESEEGWELVPLRGKFIGIKTATLDDKNMAIELITIYAQTLEAAFEPYVIEIMEKVAVPGLAFFFHEPVRVSSAKCIPQLLSSYKKAHGDQSPQIAQLWAGTVDKLLEVLMAEPTVDTLAEMYQCFYESVEVMGKNCLSADHMNKFIESAKSALEEYQTRVAGRLEEQAEREPGEEESEETLFAIEDDQTLLSDMNKAFHTIFKNQGTSFLPHWERLLNFYTTFLTNQDPTQRQWALCIMDDVLEFCGPQSWNYSQHIIQPMIAGMQDDVAANRQAASYGVGVAAQFGGEPWSEFVAASLPTLFAVTQHGQAREDDHVFATENACASIAKILHFNSTKVPNVQEIVNAWIDTLPIVNDEEAAPYAYSFLIQLIEKQNPAVYNPTQAAKSFVYIAQALEAETIQGQTANRVVAAAKHLVGAAGLDPAQLLAQLTPETQQTVRAYFS